MLEGIFFVMGIGVILYYSLNSSLFLLDILGTNNTDFTVFLSVTIVIIGLLILAVAGSAHRDDSTQIYDRLYYSKQKEFDSSDSPSIKD